MKRQQNELTNRWSRLVAILLVTKTCDRLSCGQPLQSGACLTGPQESLVARVTVSADVREKRAFGGRWIGWWPTTTLSWIATAFVIGFASAATVLAIFGVGERGMVIALRLTARWSFLLFWLAYAGGAMGRLFGSRLAGLARRGRDFGLAFASAQVVHLGLVIWLFYLVPGSNGGMAFFWVGILCTYLLALFSLPRLHDALGQQPLWRILRAAAIEYIALVFADDFILGPLQANGLGKYPLSYLPFALMLVGGVGLRVASFARQQLLPSKIIYSERPSAVD
jgi:hypothetical protein